MVRPVNLRMTIHARPSEHPVAFVHRDRVVVVDGGRMPRRDVTALTQHRHPNHEHPVVRRAVRIVTSGAIFTNRGVLPQYRPSHFGVTAHAAFSDRAPDLERLYVADRSVWVV